MNLKNLKSNRRLYRTSGTGFLCLAMILLMSSLAQAQYKWWNPAKNSFPVIENQPWGQEAESFYDRFPARAESRVRKEVWNLSENGAGLKLRFNTDAKTIIVRYVVEKKSYAMNHFPATGVSGVDLYSLNNDKTWAWANGRSAFGDTITYTFSSLDLNSDQYKNGREYHLYMPLYNNVVWMEVGVPEKSSFNPLPLTKEKPIVVYGTSIAQGGCASRPGMAWTAIVERNLHTPVVNLSFSGNGRLEKEVIDLINEIDAKMFVLDCLPNLGASSDAELEAKITESVLALRKKHPQTPILLTGHSGFIENRLNSAIRNSVTNMNRVNEQTYRKLKASGVKNLYILPGSKVDMGTDGTVDGSHPTDFGMYKYALAYEKILKPIIAKNKHAR